LGGYSMTNRTLVIGAAKSKVRHRRVMHLNRSACAG
jgi:hypothetical protein